MFQDAETAAAGIEEVFTMAADALERSDFGEGCPIGAVSLEAAGTSERIRESCAVALTTWVDVISRHLSTDGIDDRRAGELAQLSVATIEGAFVVCRALRDARPMRNAGAEVAGLIEAASSTKS